MRKAIVVLALVILVLTFLGSEVSSGRSTTKPANVHAKKSGDNPKEHPIEHPKEHKTEPHSKEHKTEPSKEHSKEHHSKEPHSKEHKTEPSKEHSKEHHSKEHHSKEHPKEHPKEHHSKEHTKTPEEKCRHVVVGPSKDAFKKNLPQDFCAIFNKGGKKAGQLKQADGSQILTGVCSNTPQGEIPKVEHMPSTLIIFPDDGKKIKRNKPFKVQVKTDKLELGFFSDPEINYNSFPQVLNKKGLIQGHQHVTIQYLGKNKKSMKTPDATKFSFFKGLNDPARNGLLAVEVDKGLPEKGIYRICTIISSFSHQPIVLPKAQRGASDDCVRITVV